jgi:positive regulator of sigma E activity
VRRIQRTGTVVGFEGDSAVVELERKRECSSSLSCACCSVPQVQRVRVPGAGLEKGDTVSISQPAYLQHLSTAVVFVLPLLLIAAGGVIGWSLSGGEGGGEAGGIVGGLCGFAVAIGLAMAVNRWASHARNMEVERIAGARS